MSFKAIRREADRPRHNRDGGAYTVQMITPDTGARDLLNGFTTIPPGSGIPLHLHNCEESVLILSGGGVVEIDSEVFEVFERDVVWIKADTKHRFRNTSSEEPLVIFWTYATADASRTIVATGEECRVAAEHI